MSTTIEENNNQATLFKVVNRLLHKGKSNALPASDTDKNLSEFFSKFFFDKVQKIRKDLDSIPKDNHVHPELPHQNLVHNLTSLDQVNMDTMKKVITSTPSKTCALDPIPTTLLT